jgi:hypothetical protein
MRNVIVLFFFILINYSCFELGIEGNNSKNKPISPNLQKDVLLSKKDTIFKATLFKEDSSIKHVSYVLNSESLIYYGFSYYKSGIIKDKIFYCNDSLNQKLNRSEFLVSYYDSFHGESLFDSIGEGVISRKAELYKRRWFESGKPKVTFDLIGNTLFRFKHDSLSEKIEEQRFKALNSLESKSVAWKLIDN